ncbi:MAG: hypothetical protein IJC66_05280 [Kiritimatiellae bacterium]|nr:hypothetical protein [Kiritimatiellia bacterium]
MCGGCRWRDVVDLCGVGGRCAAVRADILRADAPLGDYRLSCVKVRFED